MAVPTERSQFWTTGGAGDGATTFTRDQLAEGFRAAFLADNTLQGVFTGLAVSGATSPMTLAIGSACVYGFFYLCTVAGDVVKSTPSIGTTGFRVVLRASWAAQTVRVTVISSADGTASIPAAVQNAGVTWDITLATGTITTGGVITLTDARAFAHFNTAVSTAMLDALSVTAAKIAANTITAAQIANATITKTQMAFRTRKIFVQPSYAYNVTDALPAVATSTHGVTMKDNKLTQAFGFFIAPADVYGGGALSITAVSYSTAAGNIFSGLTANGGVAGANDNTDTASVADAAYAIGANTIGNEANLNTASGSDIISLIYDRNAVSASDTVNADTYFKGWLVAYTADM